MKKINKKIICIPPYISTSWSNITSLHVKEKTLFISLKNGEVVSIPEMTEDLLDTIFDSHTNHMEEQAVENIQAKKDPGSPLAFFQNIENQADLPFKFNISAIDNFGAMMQHNSSQKDAPDLPPEVLDKICSISKAIAPEDQTQIPKPEPHCNCMHCQIAGAIHKGLGIDGIFIKEEIIEEKVNDNELQFQQWDIEKTDDKLYIVINRLDVKEKYNVFLGNPVGCTCGKTGCEHILAVLKS